MISDTMTHDSSADYKRPRHYQLHFTPKSNGLNYLKTCKFVCKLIFSHYRTQNVTRCISFCLFRSFQKYQQMQISPVRNKLQTTSVSTGELSDLVGQASEIGVSSQSPSVHICCFLLCTGPKWERYTVIKHCSFTH